MKWPTPTATSPRSRSMTSANGARRMDACEIGFGAFPAECPHRSDLFSERILAPRGNRDVQKRRPDEGERPIQPELDPAVGDRTAVAVDHAGRRTGARQPAVGARDPTQDAVGHSHGFRTVFDGQAATATYQDGVPRGRRRRYRIAVVGRRAVAPPLRPAPPARRQAPVHASAGLHPRRRTRVRRSPLPRQASPSRRPARKACPAV